MHSFLARKHSKVYCPKTMLAMLFFFAFDTKYGFFKKEKHKYLYNLTKLWWKFVLNWCGKCKVYSEADRTVQSKKIFFWWRRESKKPSRRRKFFILDSRHLGFSWLKLSCLALVFCLPLVYILECGPLDGGF